MRTAMMPMDRPKIDDVYDACCRFGRGRVFSAFEVAESMWNSGTYLHDSSWEQHFRKVKSHFRQMTRLLNKHRVPVQLVSEGVYKLKDNVSDRYIEHMKVGGLTKDAVVVLEPKVRVKTVVIKRPAPVTPAAVSSDMKKAADGQKRKLSEIVSEERERRQKVSVSPSSIDAREKPPKVAKKEEWQEGEEEEDAFLGKGDFMYVSEDDQDSNEVGLLEQRLLFPTRMKHKEKAVLQQTNQKKWKTVEDIPSDSLASLAVEEVVAYLNVSELVKAEFIKCAQQHYIFMMKDLRFLDEEALKELLQSIQAFLLKQLFKKLWTQLRT